MDPAKLKVVELRAELSARGLDTKGNKPVLVERLREALNSDVGDEDKDASTGDASDEEFVSSHQSEPEETKPSRRSRATRRNRSPSPQPPQTISTPTKKSSNKRTVSFEEPKIQEPESSESEDSDSELITGDCLPTPIFKRNISPPESESDNDEVITSNEEQTNESESKVISDETQIEKSCKVVIREPKTICVSPKMPIPEPPKSIIDKTIPEKLEQPKESELGKETVKSPEVKLSSEKLSISEINIAKPNTPPPTEVSEISEVSPVVSEPSKTMIDTLQIPIVKSPPSTPYNVAEIKTSLAKAIQEPVSFRKVESSPKKVQPVIIEEPKQVICEKVKEIVKTSPKKDSNEKLSDVTSPEDIIKMDVEPTPIPSIVISPETVEEDIKVSVTEIAPESSVENKIETEKDVKQVTVISESIDEIMDTSEDASEKVETKIENESVEVSSECKENNDDLTDTVDKNNVKDRRTARKNKKSRWGNFSEIVPEGITTEDIGRIVEELPKPVEEPPMRDEKRGQKRKRSRSISPPNMEDSYNSEPQEDEPEYKDDEVLLSWFDSDLYLKIDPNNFTIAKPISSGIFEHTWAGVRASYGVSKGKVCYEVKLLEDNKLHEKNNIDPHAIRLGWSVNDNNLQLGESPFSYGYDSLGNSSCNKEFKKYGESFTTNDVIGVYLDLDSSPCNIIYTLNGINQGVAFEFEKSDLQDKALFPHILTKNISFKVNFGQEKKSLLNKPKLKKVLKKNISKIEASEVTSDNIDNIEKDDSKNISAKSDDDITEEKMESSNNLEEKQDDEKKEEEVENMEICEEKKDNPETNEEIKENVFDKLKDNIKKSDNEENKIEEYEYIEEDDEEAIGLSILESYEYIGKIELDNRVSGPKRPDSKTECELFVLCGLPGVGKTYWATEWSAQRPEKRYNILGAHSLVNRMTISGESKKSNYSGDWNSLIESCSKAVTPLLNIACKRRRNYIIDQTNIYPAVRDKKIKPFVGFVRKAIVIVPTEESWTKRKSEQDKTFSKQINDSSLLSMKAGFVLPEEDSIFTQVIYTELSESDAKNEVQKYNNEGKEAGFNMKPKRFRFDSYDSDRNERGSRSDRSDRFNRNSSRFNDRRNMDDRRNFNRRGNERFERQDRGGQRWGNNPRFGGPPPPQGGWGGGGRNNQWGGRGGGGGRHPGNWRGGPPPPPPPHRGGDHRGEIRHDRSDRSDHRGGDRGMERGDFNRGGGGRGGFGNRNANWNNRGGGDRRSSSSSGTSHQGRGGSGGRQGQVRNSRNVQQKQISPSLWNNQYASQVVQYPIVEKHIDDPRQIPIVPPPVAPVPTPLFPVMDNRHLVANTKNSNWVNPNKPPKEKSNAPDTQSSSSQSGSGSGGSGSWQNWNSNGQQNWGQGQQQQQQWGQGQNWSQGQQNWNQSNWNQQQQQGWQNQQNWGGGWKGYGQWGQQYWGQWNQGQTTGSSTTGTSTTTTTTAATNAITTSSTTSPTSTNAASGNSYSAQYSTSYPGMQQYQSGQYNAGTANATGNNASLSQAQMYQNWAQYAQAYASYGQQQQSAAGTAGSGNSIEEKKKK